jgi:spermidine synthase
MSAAASLPSPSLPAPPPARALWRRPELWLAGLAFVASGAAGLVYQVAWQRILALQSGVGIYSVAMIVAAFMAGIGIGSHLGGVWSLKLDAAAALRRFVLIEAGIALLGAASCYVYYDLLYTRAMWLYAVRWRAALLHVASLLPPTVLMGMSLPLLTRAMVSEARTAGRTIGLLYALNILGAAGGAVLTPWLLIKHLGIRGATFAAAGANVFTALAGLVAVWLLRRRAAAAAVDEGASVVAADAGDAAAARSFPLWVALYAASGFCALSLEIIWFRMLDVAVKSKAFTFGTLLALYLLGCGIGCLIGAALVQRLKRPLRAFLLTQCALLAYSGIMVVLLGHLPVDVPVLEQLYGFWSRGSYTQRHAMLWTLYGVLPGLLFGPATILMGFSFPVLQRAVQDDPRTSGRKVGLLQAANIGGCVAGSLLVGLVALRFLGTTGALRLLMVAGIGFAIVGLRAYGRRAVFLEMAVLLALVAVMLPSQRRLWLRLHGTEVPNSMIQEDATGVAALTPRRGAWLVYVDGKSHSWLPFGGVHTQLGAAPAIMHPAPVDVAIVGLGSGDTAWASACRPETRRLDVFEISGGQPRLLQRIADREPLPDLSSFLRDPRLHIQVADGRHALAHSPRQYDLIEADALWPDVAHSGNLYSSEFFKLTASKLKPGGLVCTWAPTPRIYSSFMSAFRHIAAPSNRGVLIGSNDPIDVNLPLWKERLNSEAVRRYLGEGRLRSVEQLLSSLQLHNRQGRRPRGRDQNRDLFPRDEFDLKYFGEPL